MKKICFIISTLLLLASCRNDKKPESFTLATYNVQCFFDSVTDGTEYSDFSGPKSKWNEEKYVHRLKKLSAVIKEIDSDIIALQEIENEEVLKDIINYLSMDNPYKYGAFAKESGGVFGCGVLSRYPIISMKTAQVQFFSTDSRYEVELRPQLQIFISLDESKSSDLCLFVVHWKSKSVKTKSLIKTAELRRMQEKLLASSILSVPDKIPVVAAIGDFNQDVTEFDYDESGTVLLHGFKDETHAFSPWFLSQDFENTGSYYYQDKWEKIDNIFLCRPLNSSILQDFSTVSEGTHTDEDGIPIPYKVYSDYGWSDHLPLKAKFSVLTQEGKSAF